MCQNYFYVSCFKFPSALVQLKTALYGTPFLFADLTEYVLTFHGGIYTTFWIFTFIWSIVYLYNSKSKQFEIIEKHNLRIIHKNIFKHFFLISFQFNILIFVFQRLEVSMQSYQNSCMPCDCHHQKLPAWVVQKFTMTSIFKL